MQDFRALTVWQKAHQLTLSIYQASSAFPHCEVYGLTSQLRPAAVSVASNIAEGCGRGTDSDFGRYIQIALGSASEVEYQLLLARDLELMEDAPYEQLAQQCVEVKRMLAALRRKLGSLADS